MATASLEKIGQSVQLLRSRLPLTPDSMFDASQFHEGDNVLGWKILEMYRLKVALIHDKLKVFVKIYPTITGNYSFLIFQCIQELSTLTQLPLPVLGPLMHIHQANIFEQGKPLRSQPKESIYTLEELKLIESVIERHGFVPSHPSVARTPIPLGIDAVQIGKKKFLIDPIRDLPAEIALFVRR